jgi:glucose-6-phosphate isomerase
MHEEIKRPFTFDVIRAENISLSTSDNHIVRRLSAMQNQYLDQLAYEALLDREDQVLYEVFEVKRPEVAGELLQGISIVHPGKVGEEYFMTKGHFHSVLETAEVYYCMKGKGVMVMETLGGNWAVESLQPEKVLYVPPGWAHRSVNTSSDEDLVTFFVYPGNAGHDYGSIEKHGFRKLVVERDSQVELIDNPRWLPPKNR